MLMQQGYWSTASLRMINRPDGGMCLVAYARQVQPGGYPRAQCRYIDQGVRHPNTGAVRRPARPAASDRVPHPGPCPGAGRGSRRRPSPRHRTSRLRNPPTAGQHARPGRVISSGYGYRVGPGSPPRARGRLSVWVWRLDRRGLTPRARGHRDRVVGRCGPTTPAASSTAKSSTSPRPTKPSCSKTRAKLDRWADINGLRAVEGRNDNDILTSIDPYQHPHTGLIEVHDLYIQRPTTVTAPQPASMTGRSSIAPSKTPCSRHSPPPPVQSASSYCATVPLRGGPVFRVGVSHGDAGSAPAAPRSRSPPDHADGRDLTQLPIVVTSVNCPIEDGRLASSEPLGCGYVAVEDGVLGWCCSSRGRVFAQDVVFVRETACGLGPVSGHGLLLRG